MRSVHFTYSKWRIYKFEGYRTLYLQVFQRKKLSHRTTEWSVLGWSLGRRQKRADDDAFTENKGSITRRGGMTDSVRLVWVGSMHRRADIREAMTTLTYMKHNTSEQHVELTLRGRRDMKSMEKIVMVRYSQPFRPNNGSIAISLYWTYHFRRWQHQLRPCWKRVALNAKEIGWSLLQGDINEKWSNSLIDVTSRRREGG